MSFSRLPLSSSWSRWSRWSPRSPAATAGHPWRLVVATVAVLVAPAVDRPAAAAEPVPPARPPVGSFVDESGLLGRGAGLATLRERVVRAATRGELPIAIVVVGHPGSSRQADAASLEASARARFAEEGLSEGTSDAVLLLVAPRAGQAVLETGKGEAGIVPEIDARRITADLKRRLGRRASPTTLGGALADAADHIADSALATRERRRPLADPHPNAMEGAEVPAPSFKPDGPAPVAPDAKSAPAARHRSVMPGAYALAILVTLGLALRQRRRSGANGGPPPTRRP